MQTEKEPTQQDYVIELLEELGCVPLRFAPHIVFAKQDNPPKSKKLLEVKFDGDLIRSVECWDEDETKTSTSS